MRNLLLVFLVPLFALISGCAAREAARPEVSASPPTLTPAAAAIVGLVPAETEAPQDDYTWEEFAPPVTLPTPSCPPLVTTDPNTLSKRRQSLLSLEQQIVEAGGHTTEQGAALTKDWLKLLMKPAKEQSILLEAELEQIASIARMVSLADPYICVEELGIRDMLCVISPYYTSAAWLVREVPSTPEMMPGFFLEYPISGVCGFSCSSNDGKTYTASAEQIIVPYETVNKLVEAIFGRNITYAKNEIVSNENGTAYSYKNGIFYYTDKVNLDYNLFVSAYTDLSDGLYYVQIGDTEWGGDPDCMRFVVERDEGKTWGFKAYSILRAFQK